MKKLSTPKDFMRDYHTSELSQWRYRRSGELEFYRISGRIYYDAEMIDAFLERRKNKTNRPERPICPEAGSTSFAGN